MLFLLAVFLQFEITKSFDLVYKPELNTQSLPVLIINTFSDLKLTVFTRPAQKLSCEGGNFLFSVELLITNTLTDNAVNPQYETFHFCTIDVLDFLLNRLVNIISTIIIHNRVTSCCFTFSLQLLSDLLKNIVSTFS